MPDSPQLRIVLDSPVPVYRQLVDQLRSLCVEGRLKPETKLPSVRELAGNLGVHFNTVAEAYRALAEEGWLMVEHGRGVRVIDRRAPRLPSAAAANAHGSRLRHLIAELRALGHNAAWIRREVEAALSIQGDKS